MKVRTLALLALAAAIAPLALELGVRAAGFSAPFWHRPDPRVGQTLRPGTQGWYTREGPRNFVRVNAAGFRDREHTLDKAENTYRIAVLGDEQSEALQLPLEKTWWSLLGADLEACGVGQGRRVEMLNFGIESFGTGQELAMLETTAMRYQPDLVLLQFSPGNDAQNNSFALAVEKERPFYRLDAGGALHVDDSFNATPAFARHASPAHEIARRIGDRSRGFQYLITLPGRGFFPRAYAAGVQTSLFAPPRDALWEEAWGVTEALIARAHDYSRRNGARFVLVAIPEHAQVHPERLRREASDLFYPDKRIGGFAARKGILAIFIAQEMAVAAAGRSFYYKRLLNEEGSRIAAELIAQRICAGAR